VKILDLATIPLSYTLPSRMWDAHLDIPVREGLLVQVITDEGIQGIGECAVFGRAISAVQSVITEQLRPLVTGRDPLLIENLWQIMYDRTIHLGRAGVVMAAISGVDIALWDILGKVAGMPVYRLLGGYASSLQTYASSGFYGPDKDGDKLAAELLGHKEQGFSALKMKVGALSPAEDAARVRRVRDRIGTDVALMVDANCGYTPHQAIRFAKCVDDLDIRWLEEPVRADDIEGSKVVADARLIPVAGYESESSPFVFRRMINLRSVDIVQADATWVGGITSARKIAALAAAANMMFVPHVYSSAVALLANMHLLAACANGGPLEVDRNPNPLRDDIIQRPIALGPEMSACVPETPGLGAELVPDAIEHYSLH